MSWAQTRAPCYQYDMVANALYANKFLLHLSSFLPFCSFIFSSVCNNSYTSLLLTENCGVLTITNLLPIHDQLLRSQPMPASIWGVQEGINKMWAVPVTDRTMHLWSVSADWSFIATCRNICKTVWSKLRV